MTYVLDSMTITNIVMVGRGKPETRAKRRRVLQRFEDAGATGAVGLTVVQIAELLWGAYQAGRPDVASALRAFWEPLPIYTWDAAVGELWARTRAAPHQFPGDRDFITAVIALQHGLTVVTEDSDYGRIPGLAVVDWSK